MKRFALFAAVSLSEVSAIGITLGWHPGAETVVQGYRVYSGSSSGKCTVNHDAGLKTSIVIDDLVLGQTYCFAVVAIGSSGLESPLSEEVIVDVSPPPLPTGGTLAPTKAGGICLQWPFPIEAMDSLPEFIIQASADLVNWTEIATVLRENSTRLDDQSGHFSWTIPATSGQMFYLLTARNWVGESTAP